MTRFIGPEVVELFWVPTISVLTAPTTTEINAGTDMSVGVIPNGAVFPNPGTTVDASDGSSKFDKQVAGTTGGQKAVITFHREKPLASDTIYTTLAPGTTGYFVTGPRGWATGGTAAVADDVNVFAVEIITRDEANLFDRGNTQQFTVEAAITEAPTYDYQLAA